MLGARRATARDVAARAGVSVGTVSKAFSGRGAVSDATRRRIMDVAAELGYDGGARLGGSDEPRARTVGLITSDRFGRLTVPVLLGAIETLAEQEIALIVCDGRGDPIREQHFIETLLRRHVDGILVTGTGISSRNSIGRDLSVPVVYALSWSRDPSDFSVIPDDAAGAAAVAQHLIDTGRRKIAFASGPSAIQDSAPARLAAITRVLEANSLALAHEPLYWEWTESWGRQAAAQILASGREVDAIICGNDQLARGCVETLRDKGVQVPRDVAVVGFDNWDVMVEATRPQLSTVELNLGAVGHVAARELLNAIGGRPPSPGIERLPTRVVPRGSSAVM